MIFELRNYGCCHPCFSFVILKLKLILEGRIPLILNTQVSVESSGDVTAGMIKIKTFCGNDILPSEICIANRLAHK